MGSTNPFISFLISIILIFGIFGLITVLAHVIVFAIVVAGGLFVLFWIKNKLFPNKLSSQEKIKIFTQRMNDYQASHKNQDNYENHEEKHEGRIIDVEPDR